MHDEAILTTGTYPAMAQKINGNTLSTGVFSYPERISSLCVCPYMADYFQKLYGVPGDVLYPNRAAGINGFDEPPERLTETNRPLTFGYAGSLWLPSYVRSLVMLSAIAKKTGDQLPALIQPVPRRYSLAFSDGVWRFIPWCLFA